MSRRLYLFFAWCMVMFLLSAAAGYYAWTPFSDEDRGSGAVVRGPRHK